MSAVLNSTPTLQNERLEKVYGEPPGLNPKTFCILKKHFLLYHQGYYVKPDRTPFWLVFPLTVYIEITGAR